MSGACAVPACCASFPAAGEPDAAVCAAAAEPPPSSVLFSLPPCSARRVLPPAPALEPGVCACLAGVSAFACTRHAALPFGTHEVDGMSTPINKVLAWEASLQLCVTAATVTVPSCQFIDAGIAARVLPGSCFRLRVQPHLATGGVGGEGRQCATHAGP